MRCRAATLCALASLLATAALAEAPSAAEIVERYVAARGGAERWAAVESLELSGAYAAFSEKAPFTLLRGRGDRYLLQFTLLGSPAVRARDGEGPWWVHGLIQPEAARITEGPYKSLLERESIFGPALLGHEARGWKVEAASAGDVDGRPTVNLEVTLPDGAKETWFLDAETYLEVAVDSQVIDYTQGPKPMRQRAFFDDFREVDGLVLPFRVDFEFGARLEAMEVERASVGGAVDDSRFAPPG